MDKVVLLNRPLWFVDYGGDIRKIVEVFGFLISQKCFENGFDATVIEGYLEYLCGVSKWEQEGNTVDDCTWVSNLTGETYDYFDPFIQKYLKRAKQQKYLTYLIFETNKILDNDTKGMLDGEFVISRDLYNNILEYGVIAECGCQNNDGNWTVGGSLKEKKSQ